MRTMFPGHFRPTNDGLKKLWSECLFAVDANVLLNLYRYSPETRKELESALSGVRDQLFLPNWAAREFLKNRLTVTASQADEYTKAAKTIADLSTTLSNKKKHPFLGEVELPQFQNQVSQLVEHLNAQREILLQRLNNDEILEFAERVFEGKTGAPFEEDQLREIAKEGETRYQKEIPPGFRDAKKDSDNDPFRRYGDLIVWKQVIAESIAKSRAIVFITDDKKDDWWLEQSGRTIGPRPDLHEEFINATKQPFWMYTVDRLIEEAASARSATVSAQVIAEIKEISEEVKAERTARSSDSYNFYTGHFRAITKDELVQRIDASEKWASENGIPFLGLSSYVRTYLGNAGYDYATSYELMRELQEEGVVEVYDHQGEGHERPVKAFRLVRKNAVGNTPFESLPQLLSVANA